MKKSLLWLPFMALTVLLSVGGAYAQQSSSGGSGSGTTAPQQGGWYCPWCGSMQAPCPGMRFHGGMGSGMMQGGYGMGPGMMHHGRGKGPQKYGQQGGKPLTQEQIKTLVQNYLDSTGNPNLKLGQVTKEKDKDYYLAEVTTKDGSLVDKIEVNEYTGWFRSAYSQ